MLVSQSVACAEREHGPHVEMYCGEQGGEHPDCHDPQVSSPFVAVKSPDAQTDV